MDRDEAHRTGTWHGAFHCLIAYRRGVTACALFQKRSAAKKIAPGKFDVSVGGHYASGEDARSAGPREIREELGLAVPFEALVPAGRRIFVYCFTPGVREYEFQDVFLLPLPVDPGALRLQEEEVEGVLEVDLDAGLRLFGREAGRIECSFFAGPGPERRVTVSADEFVPCLDRYYLKLLLLAKRFFAGERFLAI